MSVEILTYLCVIFQLLLFIVLGGGWSQVSWAVLLVIMMITRHSAQQCSRELSKCYWKLRRWQASASLALLPAGCSGLWSRSVSTLLTDLCRHPNCSSLLTQSQHSANFGAAVVRVGLGGVMLCWMLSQPSDNLLSHIWYLDTSMASLARQPG